MTADHIDRERIERAVRELLIAIGEDPARAELSATPARVAASYAEFFSGVGVDVTELLAESVPVGEQTGELVLLRDIEVRSMCEHHLLPFRGVCHIAYRPGERVVGLSALPRLVDALARRPQIQERLTEEIAEALDHAVSPDGVLVVIDASHGCVNDRGTRQNNSTTVTVASRGSLSDVTQRADVMTLIGGNRS